MIKSDHLGSFVVFEIKVVDGDSCISVMKLAGVVAEVSG